MVKKSKPLLSVLFAVFLLAFSVFPAVSSAAAVNVNLDAQLKLFAKANLLNVVKVKADCDSIVLKVTVKSLAKLLAVVGTDLKATVPYEIYELPNKEADISQGKLVKSGVFEPGQGDKEFKIEYHPKASAYYVVKVKLLVGAHLVGQVVLVNVDLGVKCQNPGQPGQPGGGDQPGGNNPGGNNPGGNNPGGNNPGGNQPGTNNPGGGSHQPPQGGQLPKTATEYPINMVFALVAILLGVALYILSVRNKGKSIPV
ncbi:hypothetical protein [Thermoactinomyces sp. CICC 10522]|uniref:hypothetical protein n=1 Tax=Thermoactinomyces sp. CICC 10522 TaxID=2767427 RepID=UPI0018DCC6C6|nr:hypothetical protein [Thermoactinomyces sp. CICC 10522]MBH8605936.1 hypothetical protein [Thermoactinomyces sp. CICC 10522]